MQYLERLSGVPSATWYAVRGDHSGSVERFVVTTPETRRICNAADLVGVDYNLALEQGMTAAFAHAPFRDFVGGHPQEKVCIVNFLRGGPQLRAAPGRCMAPTASTATAPPS